MGNILLTIYRGGEQAQAGDVTCLRSQSHGHYPACPDESVPLRKDTWPLVSGVGESASAGGDHYGRFMKLPEWVRGTKAKVFLPLLLPKERNQYLLVFSFKRLGPWQPWCQLLLSMALCYFMESWGTDKPPWRSTVGSEAKALVNGEELFLSPFLPPPILASLPFSLGKLVPQCCWATLWSAGLQVLWPKSLK